MKFGLSEITIQEIMAILARSPHVEKAILYGSRALGTHKNGSDVDLALFGETLKQHDLLTLIDAFEESDTPYKIDLCLYSKIENHNLKDHIKRVGIVFYQASNEQQ